MIRCAHLKFSPPNPEKFFPEGTGEYLVSVRHNAQGQTMKLDNSVRVFRNTLATVMDKSLY